jgi:hypothetical protein
MFWCAILIYLSYFDARAGGPGNSHALADGEMLKASIAIGLQVNKLRD